MGSKARKSYRRNVVRAGETSTKGFWILILDCNHAASRGRGPYDKTWPPKTIYCNGCERVDRDIAKYEWELSLLRQEKDRMGGQ